MAHEREGYYWGAAKASKLPDGGFAVSGDFTQLRNNLLYSGGEPLVPNEYARDNDTQAFVAVVDGKPIATDLYVGLEDEQARINYGEWTTNSMDKLKNAVMQIAEGKSIPESIAKYRGAEQVRAGGQFDVDTEVEDFSDALAALGITRISFKPQEAYASSVSPTTPVTASDSSGSGSSRQQANTYNAGMITGIVAVVLLAGLLYAVMHQ